MIEQAMETKRTFEYRKKTGSYADELAAVGLAAIVENIGQDQGVQRQVTIADQGDRYVITAEPALTYAEVLNWTPRPCYRYFRAKETDPLPSDSAFEVYDYPKERERETVYKAFLAATKGKRGKGRKHKNEVMEAIADEGETSPPDLELGMWKIFNGLRMGSEAPNLLYQAIISTAGLQREVAFRLGLGPRSSPQEFDPSPLAKAASILQLFNPLAGKGIHRPKPDGTTPGGFPDRWLDWFDEWLKLAGMRYILLAYPTGQDGKDSLVMCLRPYRVDLMTLYRLRRGLLDARLWGELSLQIKAILVLARLLVENSAEYREEEIFRFNRRRVSEIVGGYSTAYFKSLGTASAVINASSLGVPGWFPIGNREDAQAWLDTLGEVEQAQRALSDDRSDDIPVLLAMRDFLSTGSLEATLRFFALYAEHLMKVLGQGKRIPAFTLAKVRRMFMSFDVQEITTNPGFNAIATAIRKSTVNLLFRKAMGKPAPFEIRYGLAQTWKRKAKFPAEFLAELAQFVQEYNGENARNALLGKETRDQITEDHLRQVEELIRKYGTELVAMLLLAHGYARDTREEGAK